MDLIRIISTVAFLLCLSWKMPCASGLEEFVPGAVPILEPENEYPIMYSSVIPLLYQFHLPSWDMTSMKIQFWKQHNNCTQSDTYESGYPCPIIYHMNKIIENFASNMTYWKNLFLSKRNLSKSSPAEFLHDPSILRSKEVCTSLKIEPHFKTIQASSQQVKEYVDVLSQCAEKNGTIYNKKVANLSNSAVKLENSYHDTFASFTADFWNLLSTSVSREAISLVAWSALESGLMIHQYAETQKWTHAIESCKNHQIPWTLISTESLKSMLTSLKFKYLEQESKDFSLSLENMSRYFRLPLADCVFADENTFLVRILVPVIPEEAQSKNYFARYHPIPFVSDGKICSFWEGKASIAFSPGLNGILPCSCAKSDTFCKGWDAKSYASCPSLHEQEEACIHALSSDIEEEIVEHCSLKCRAVDVTNITESDLKIERMDLKDFIIPGRMKGSNNSTFIDCPSMRKSMEFRLEATGAYEVTLPTGCTLANTSSTGNTIVSEIEDASVTHLLPYLWRKGIVAEADSVSFEDTIVDRVAKIANMEPKIHFLASKLAQFNRECKENVAESSLWILVILSLFMNVCLGFIVFRITKWKSKVNVSLKSNRIVYNITSSDDDFPITEQMRNPLCPNSNTNNDL